MVVEISVPIRRVCFIMQFAYAARRVKTISGSVRVADKTQVSRISIIQSARPGHTAPFVRHRRRHYRR